MFNMFKPNRTNNQTPAVNNNKKTNNQTPAVNNNNKTTNNPVNNLVKTNNNPVNNNKKPNTNQTPTVNNLVKTNNNPVNKKNNNTPSINKKPNNNQTPTVNNLVKTNNNPVNKKPNNNQTPTVNNNKKPNNNPVNKKPNNNQTSPSVNNNKKTNNNPVNNLVKTNNNQTPTVNNNNKKNANMSMTFEKGTNKTKLVEAFKRTNTDVTAKSFLKDITGEQLNNVSNMKTFNGNKVYYKKDEQGAVRPVIIFIKAMSDSLNKTNLRILANVLSDKTPVRGTNSNNYMFTESGPFGSGYYHTGFFQKSGNKVMTNVNVFENPLFDPNALSPASDTLLRELKYGEALNRMATLKSNNNSMTMVPNNLFDNYTLSSKQNRVRNLTRVIDSLQKKNKRN